MNCGEGQTTAVVPAAAVSATVAAAAVVAAAVVRDQKRARRDVLSSTENETQKVRTDSSTRWRCSDCACILNHFSLTKTYQQI